MHASRYIFPLLSILLLALLAADVCCGSVFIPLASLLDESGLQAQILWNLRLPKALTAILAGAALSVSGLMMQTLFRNPLAGPYILGVSSGASLGVAIATMCGTLWSGTLLTSLLTGTIGSWIAGSGIVLGGVLGGLIVLLLVMAVSHRVESNVSLLIVGMMFGSIAGALVSMIQNFSNPDALKLFIVWTLGSLGNVGWRELSVLVPILLLTSLVLVWLIKPLNGLMLGENYARGLGIDVQRTRWAIVLTTGLLAGSVTAYCGPIAFVGVAVPHIARGWFATSNHRVTVPACALIGANLLLICDLLSSLSTYPLPISTMSALFGAPIIVWIILKRNT